MMQTLKQIHRVVILKLQVVTRLLRPIHIPVDKQTQQLFSHTSTKKLAPIAGFVFEVETTNQTPTTI